MFLCPRLCSLGVPLGLGWGGGGAPDAGSGPSPREFPHGGADACTPRQGVTLLYGPSICTRSVQMDLRRIQVRRPFPTPGSGTLWVSGESLRVRHVSCLPRWTVCPTRSPSQDTNRSTCRGECSWSGPLATPPGRCHLGPLAIGPGRNPPYCSRSDGPDTDTGGPPNPRGRVPHQRCSRALVTPPPPVGPCIPSFIPRGADPGPLLCPLAPAMSRLPLLPVPALACWCPWLLALCFFFLFSFFSHCLLAALALSAAGRRRRGRGGGVLAVLPFAQARRKHGAGTRLGTCPSAGGGGVAVWPPSSPYPSCGCTAIAPLGHGRLAPLSLHPAAASPGGGPPPATVIPLVPSPSPRCPRLCPWWVREVGAWGGGVRPRCPSSGVSTSQARHWHAARHLSSFWGVRHAVWPLSLPFPRCALSPGAPPAGEGGPLPALPFPQPPPLGGRRLVGGGGFVVFLPLPSRRRHEAWLSSLCRGGGG